MCFRPDSAGGGGPMKCPGCGKPIQMMAGITLDKCPFCKEDFTPYLWRSEGSWRSEGPRCPEGSWRVIYVRKCSTL